MLDVVTQMGFDTYRIAPFLIRRYGHNSAFVSQLRAFWSDRLGAAEWRKVFARVVALHFAIPTSPLGETAASLGVPAGARVGDLSSLGRWGE